MRKGIALVIFATACSGSSSGHKLPSATITPHLDAADSAVACGDDIALGGNTTPDAVTLQGKLSEMLRAGVTHVVMEVSSHALDQQRVTGVHFSVDSRYDYGEAFAGLSGERWNMRLHYAPESFRLGAAISIASILILGALCVLAWREKSRQSGSNR